MLPSGSGHKLREAERAAKQAKKGMWHNWTPPATNSAKLADKFTGIVREVVGGDMLSILDSASGAPDRQCQLGRLPAKFPLSAAPGPSCDTACLTLTSCVAFCGADLSHLNVKRLFWVLFWR